MQVFKANHFKDCTDKENVIISGGNVEMRTAALFHTHYVINNETLHVAHICYISPVTVLNIPKARRLSALISMVKNLTFFKKDPKIVVIDDMDSFLQDNENKDDYLLLFQQLYSNSG